MNAMTHTAHVLDTQRATALAREVELLRRQAERPESVITRPSLFVIVTGWFAGVLNSPRRPRRALAAH